MSKPVVIGNAELWHGDYLDVLPKLQHVDALITDPPYGMGYNPASNAKRRDKLCRRDKDFSPIIGDDKPFNPLPLLGYPKVILWGGNWYADKLPPSSKWLIWDKRENTGSDNGADCEMAWTNLPGTVRMFSHLWRGICRRGEENVTTGGARLHPFQKPVALMAWCLEQAGIKPGQTVLDTHMGSASLGIACLRLGIHYIGIDIDQVHFNTAVSRIKVETAQKNLFEGAEVC